MNARLLPQESDIGSVVTRIRYERRLFRCPSCEDTWTERYEIRDYRGTSGARWIVDTRDGAPVAPPAFGARCPRCGHVSVTSDRTIKERKLQNKTV